MRERAKRLALVFFVLLVSGCRSGDSSHAEERPETIVAAAASLRGVLPTLIDRWEATAGGGKIVATYGASGSLQKQVEGGAPVDLVLFASRKPVDALVEKTLVDGDPVRLATNSLVLIGPPGAKPLTFRTIDKAPPGERIAIGEPGAVPAGDYAKSALQQLGKWDGLEDRLVYGGDVSAVLAYARRGEVAAAIVYSTEAAQFGSVVVLDEARGDWAPAAEVVGAVVRTGANATGGKAFLEWLSDADAQKVLDEAGFGSP